MSERQILLLLQFDGTAYHGWQSQSGAPTVQDALEKAILGLSGERTRVLASSRLDAGVHARGLPVSSWTSSRLPVVAYERGLARHLPGDISVVEAVEAGALFDVRRMSRGKVYRYTVWNGRFAAPLVSRWSWHVAVPLDVEAMRRAATALVGEHDFSSFRAAGCQAKHAHRRVDRLEIEERDESQRLTFVVEGNAFLQHMVRIVAGTLVEVGRGNRPLDFPAEALAARRREAAGPTAPARGLLLDRVIYEPSPFSREPPRPF